MNRKQKKARLQRLNASKKAAYAILYAKRLERRRLSTLFMLGKKLPPGNYHAETVLRDGKVGVLVRGTGHFVPLSIHLP